MSKKWWWKNSPLKAFFSLLIFTLDSGSTCEESGRSAGQYSLVNTYHPCVISWQKQQAGIAGSLGRTDL